MKKRAKRMRIAIAIVILVFFSGAAFGPVFYRSYALTSAAGRMLSLIKENKTQEAYLSASQELRKSTPYDQFTAFIKQTNINQYKKIRWGAISQSDNSGSVDAALTIAEDKTLPLEMRLAREAGAWKVHSIDLKTDAPKVRPPEDEEIQELARGTMSLFAEAVRKKDFTNFYDAISEQWKTQIDVKTITEAFASFIDKKIDLSFLKISAPVFSEAPTISNNGILKLIGHYPSKKTDLLFELEYGYEAIAWKLIRINAQVK